MQDKLNTIKDNLLEGSKEIAQKISQVTSSIQNLQTQLQELVGHKLRNEGALLAIEEALKADELKPSQPD
ncbi:MAG: hypothetical protein FWB85_05475 [Chitinispirillia bacterium]|nr:hypothetical protein [Chitinispirillia bacterium]MCL2241675.1 hypothetical protein [Chitinispirillia bacterium]